MLIFLKGVSMFVDGKGTKLWRVEVIFLEGCVNVCGVEG